MNIQTIRRYLAQSHATSTTIIVFTVLTFLGLAAISIHFASERWAYRYRNWLKSSSLRIRSTQENPEDTDAAKGPLDTTSTQKVTVSDVHPDSTWNAILLDKQPAVRNSILESSSSESPRRTNRLASVTRALGMVLTKPKPVPIPSLSGSRIGSLKSKLGSLKITKDLAAHELIVRHLQFSPDGKFLATSR